MKVNNRYRKRQLAKAFEELVLGGFSLSHGHVNWVWLETEWSAFSHLVFDGMVRERTCKRCGRADMEKV